jgi:hypothetical protein
MELRGDKYHNADENESAPAIGGRVMLGNGGWLGVTRLYFEDFLLSIKSLLIIRVFINRKFVIKK